MKSKFSRRIQVIVNGTAFEFPPPHGVPEVFPMAPETEVVPLSGGLKTNTSTCPAAAMSAADIAATNW
jgi:hypothetical protein